MKITRYKRVLEITERFPSVAQYKWEPIEVNQELLPQTEPNDTIVSKD
jgi:hypothetical protein